MILTCVCIATVVAALVWWQLRVTRMMKTLGNLPGPPALPLIGNALFFIHNPSEQLSKFEQLTKDYGEYVRFWLGPDLNVIVGNPTDLKLLLTSNKVNLKGPLYDVLNTFIGPGILTGGDNWRNHRKIATPTYNKKTVQYFGKTFNEETYYLAEALSKKDPNLTFNIYHDIVRCTTQCVCQTLLGFSKEDTQKIKKLEEVIVKTPRIYSFILKKMTRWWLHIPLIFWLIGARTKEKEYVKLVDEFCEEIISLKKLQLKRNPEFDEETLDVISRFMFSNLSHQDTKFETFTLFTTSQEASAKIASAVLLFLAYLPEWQEKVYQEIVDVLGPNDEYVPYEDLKKLQYLDMVYKEALRYLPIAGLIQRTVEEDVEINNGKITVPAGASLLIAMHLVHRDEHYWESPHLVMPERFLPENVAKRDPNAFLPFGFGPMDCLGRVYATAVIKIMVVRVLRQVILIRPPDAPELEDMKLHYAISVKFANGYNVRVKPRKNV